MKKVAHNAYKYVYNPKKCVKIRNSLIPTDSKYWKYRLRFLIDVFRENRIFVGYNMNKHNHGHMVKKFTS